MMKNSKDAIVIKMVEFPGCAFCKRTEVAAFACRSCKKYSCEDCHRGYNSSDRCTHVIYKPITVIPWGE